MHERLLTKPKIAPRVTDPWLRSADRHQRAVAHPTGAVAPEIAHRSDELEPHWDNAGTVRVAGTQSVEPPP